MTISITGLIVTIKTTKNFWQVIALMRSKQKKRIIFRNGLVLHLSILQYIYLRDLFASGCKIEKLTDNQFRVKGRAFEIDHASELLPASSNKQKNINIKWFEQINQDTFKVETDKIKLVGEFGLVYAFFEMTEGVYNCECVGKIVLDVGGFQGETAAYFSSIGAQKVIIYEPVVAHHKFIETNMAMNNVNAELHKEGIGNINGNQTIHYENFDLGFSSLGTGPKSGEIRIRNIVDVIKESNADIAKFDCEGSETALLQVPVQILRRISYYMIEVHSSEIMAAINQKFTTSGFKLTRNILVRKDKDSVISVFHFAKT